MLQCFQWILISLLANLTTHDGLEETYDNELAPVNLPFLPNQIKYDRDEALVKQGKISLTDTTTSDVPDPTKLLRIIEEMGEDIKVLMNDAKVDPSGIDRSNHSSDHRFFLLQIPDGFALSAFSNNKGKLQKPIGKLKLYKSGKSILCLDNCSQIPMAVNTGLSCPFLQKVVSIDKECKEMNCLGDIRAKLIVAPLIEKCGDWSKSKEH